MNSLIVNNLSVCCVGKTVDTPVKPDQDYVKTEVCVTIISLVKYEEMTVSLTCLQVKNNNMHHEFDLTPIVWVRT